MLEKNSTENWRKHATAVLMMVIFAFAAININQYLYGIDNQALKIPILKKFLNSNLYPNDPLVDQGIYLYTSFWRTLGLLIQYLSIKMTILFFIVHFTSLVFTFLAVYRLSSLLFRNENVALLALFFLLFSKNTLGGDATIYRFLDSAMVARPMLLFAMYYFFKRRFLKSYLLQGLAFLIHPLSAIYMIAIVGVISLLNIKQIGPKKFAVCVAVLMLLMSPSVIWKVGYTPKSLSLFSADTYWVELLRLRSSHHVFPLSWEKGTLIQTTLYLVAFFVSRKHRPEARYHRLIVYASMTVFCLWGVATVFSEWWPMPIIMQLQFFRSAYFLYIFALIYITNHTYHSLAPDTNYARKAIAVILAAALLYDARVWLIAVPALVLFSFWRLMYQFFSQRELSDTYFRNSLNFVVLAMGLGAFFLRGGISIDNAQNPAWLAVQNWARHHTAFDDLFIIPPLIQLEGFRIAAERSSYGDWKDGTMMFFNPAYGYKWYERMKRLGYVPPDKSEFAFDEIDARLERGYNKLSEDNFLNIAREMHGEVGNVFVVHFQDRPPLDFQSVYQNDQFVVYSVLPEGEDN